MATEQAVHMNGGQGDKSYARNSSLQNAEQNHEAPNRRGHRRSAQHQRLLAKKHGGRGPGMLLRPKRAHSSVDLRRRRPQPVSLFPAATGRSLRLPQRSSRQRLQHGGEELGCVPAKPQVGCHRCYTRVVLREALHQWLLASRLLSHQPALALQGGYPPASAS